MNSENIEIEMARKWLKSGEAVLVDVREKEEHDLESIEGAILIPLSKFDERKLEKYKDKKIIFHCQGGGRSSVLCHKLSEKGEFDCYNLLGGIRTWYKSGCATQRSKKCYVPLDRQVQIVVGFFVLIGSLGGYFLNKVFLFIPMFFGGGLIFAGVTGICTLLLIMAKLPWNQK